MRTRVVGGSALLRGTAATPRVAPLVASVVGISSLVALAPRTALAADCDTSVASTCINSDTLWPHAGPTQFAAIGATETVARGNVSFGLVASYLSRPIVLKTPSPGPGGGESFAINDQVNGTFLFAVGVLDRLQLDAVLPVTFGQSGGGASAITGGDPVKSVAMRDARFGIVYAALPRNRVQGFTGDAGHDAVAPAVFALTLRSELSVPTGDETQFAGERGVAWIPSAVADYRRKRFFGAIEIGARIRAASELLGARVGTQALFSAGVGLDLFDRRDLLSVAVEARALPALTSTVAPAEWMLSARSAPFLAGDLGFQVGGGGGIPLGDGAAVTTPRFRFLLGIRYAPLARDTDGDGVLDKDDKCPYTHGAPGTGAGDGCPVPKTALPESAAPSPPAPAGSAPPTSSPATSGPPGPVLSGPALPGGGPTGAPAGEPTKQP